jgi:hypothetical protein
MDNAQNPVFDSSVCVDWEACLLVERVPGRASGVRHSMNSRIPADCMVSNFDPCGSPEEIAECSECRTTLFEEHKQSEQ